MLVRKATHVVGVDVSQSAVRYAADHHRSPVVSYVQADLDVGLPFREESIDSIVSFETLEHISQPAQMIRECQRVLRPGGQLILSTPDRFVYSELPGYSNPFHHSELNRNELIDLLSQYLEIQALYGQVRWVGSIWRSRLRQAVKRRLPVSVANVVRSVDGLRRRVVDEVRSEEFDDSLHPIDLGTHGAELYFFILAVAHKREG
jgi:ubiquinone/menaquinone biosynthesis C-methylase UbiE